MFVGIPGAGKTTLANSVSRKMSNTILLRGADIVDALDLYGDENVGCHRTVLEEMGFENPDPWYISYHYQETLTGELLDLGYNVVFDDHIRTRENRQGYFELANRFDARTIFVQINAPFKTYFEREEDDEGKMDLMLNMVFQSEDFDESEIKNYSRVIPVDGTSSPEEIEKVVMKEI